MAQESIIPREAIFRETFNSFNDIAKNWGTPVNVTLDNWTVDLDSSTWFMPYKISVNGTYSIRMICTPTDNLNYLFDFRDEPATGVGYAYLSPTSGTVTKSNGTLYVNWKTTPGVAIWWERNDLVITGITLDSLAWQLFTIGTRANANNKFLWTNDLFEIYEWTLTAEEVSALYNNNLYKEPRPQTVDGKEVLDIDPRGWIIVDRYENAITNTAVTVVKDNSYAMEFNGSTSKLAIPSVTYNILTARYTFEFMYKFDTTDTGYGFMGNSTDAFARFIRHLGTGVIQLETNTNADDARGTLNDNDTARHMLHITCDAGTIAMFQDWVVMAMSDRTITDNITLDLIGGGSDFFGGRMWPVKIIERVYTNEEIVRAYQSTKNYYIG